MALTRREFLLGMAALLAETKEPQSTAIVVDLPGSGHSDAPHPRVRIAKGRAERLEL